MVSRLLVALTLASLLGATSATGQVDPALVRWYEQAYAYYNSVQNGQEPRPDAEEWNEFLDQMQWASEQLGSQSAWDPYGGAPGPSGNTVYRGKRVRIAFVGKPGVHDIWSKGFTLDVASTSATVAVETTTDTRSNPPEEVIKIVVSDPATGTTAVYYVHDYDHAMITIDHANSSQVTDPTGKVQVRALPVRKPGPPPRRRG